MRRRVSVAQGQPPFSHPGQRRFYTQPPPLKAFFLGCFLAETTCQRDNQPPARGIEQPADKLIRSGRWGDDGESSQLYNKGSSANCGVFSDGIAGGSGARPRQGATDRPLEFQPGP